MYIFNDNILNKLWTLDIFIHVIRNINNTYDLKMVKYLCPCTPIHLFRCQCLITFINFITHWCKMSCEIMGHTEQFMELQVKNRNMRNMGGIYCEFIYFCRYHFSLIQQYFHFSRYLISSWFFQIRDSTSLKCVSQE